MVVMIMMQPGDDRRRSSQRLPVNPRRNKVPPEHRKRVVTACNGCNVRRIKCSGERPCRQCTATSRECVYPVAVEKVSVPRAELNDLQRRLDAYERALNDAVPDASRRQELVQRFVVSSPASSASPGSMATANPAPSPGFDQQTSAAGSLKTEPMDEEQMPLEGRLLNDTAGTAHFFGETSEAAFLDHLKELLGGIVAEEEPHAVLGTRSHFLSSIGCLSTADSQPLHDLEVEPLWLPAPRTLHSMLTELRHFIQDGNGEWPSGGIFWWGDLSSQPPLSSSPTAAATTEGRGELLVLKAHRPLAFYQAALAFLCQSTTPRGRGSPSDPLPSEAPYSRAMALLGNPLEVAQCYSGDASTLALLGLYMLETNRVEGAHAYVSAAMRVCAACGMHRGSVDEASKRVFWTVYVLDRWISCLVGRPHSIEDAAIRLPLPVDTPSFPPAAGLTAHVELQRIAGRIESSASRAASAGRLSQSADKALWELGQWLSSLPSTLQLDEGGLSSDPGCCLLHMGYSQLVLVATRPLFLSNVREVLSRQLARQGPWFVAQPLAGLHTASLSAAHRTIRLVRHVVSLGGGRRRLPHLSLHFLFTAATCLLLHGLVFGQNTPTEDEPIGEENVRFSTQLLDEVGQTGNGYASECSRTLHELSKLANTLQPLLHAELAATTSLPLELSASAVAGVGAPETFEDLMAWIETDWSSLENASMFGP